MTVTQAVQLISQKKELWSVGSGSLGRLGHGTSTGGVSHNIATNCISPVTKSLEYILFDNSEYTLFHGIYMEKPRANNWEILKTVFHITYQRKGSRKNRTRSMVYMIMRANALWFLPKSEPGYLVLHP
jgi:protein gp37